MVAPKLRFQEFDDAWNKKRLDSFLERISNPVDVVADQQYTQIGIRSHGKGIFHKGSIDGKELGNKRVFWIEPNTLVVNIVFAWERAIAVTSDSEKGMIASHRFPMYLPKNNLSNVNFLRYFFVTNKGQKYLELASPGGAGRNKTLGQSNFAELKIDLPSLKEQTKIANFLSAVDEKIAQLSQKLHLLEQYKQGMMQKIFSQQIRFKAGDGSQFGAWESKKLNEIGQSFNGLVGKSKEDFGEGEAYITYKQIFDHRKINLNNINFVNISPNDTQNMVKKGDIFFTTSSETANEVAYCSVILDDFEFPLYLNSFCFGYRPNSAKIFNSAYASFYFRSNIFRNKIKHLAQGSTRFNISKIAFMNVLIHLPMLEEQTQIANFLSTIDQKIDVVSEQLKQAKIWKKGLLQQMFV